MDLTQSFVVPVWRAPSAVPSVPAPSGGRQSSHASWGRVRREWPWLLGTILWTGKIKRRGTVRVRLAVQVCSTSLCSGVEQVQGENEELPVCSATSFATYLQSDFCAWMERLASECPDHPLCSKKVRDDGVANMFREKGFDVEEALVSWIRSQHPDWTLVDLEKWSKDCSKNDWRSASAQHTLKALEAEVDVLYQAPLYHRKLKLYGIADFILRVESADGTSVEYIIWDTKLSSHAQGHYLAQLAFYAEALSSMFLEHPNPTAQGRTRVVTRVGLVPGEAAKEGTAVEFQFADLRPFFLQGLEAFRHFQQRFDPQVVPEPLSGLTASNGGRWADAALHLLAEEDDLIIVAGMFRSQRRKLHACGIKKLQQLAELSSSKIASVAKTSGLPRKSLEKIWWQAKLQHKSNVTKKPASKLLPTAKETLQHLPQDSPGDLFLDLEGSPTSSSPLNYLIGIYSRDAQYHTWWAHTLEDEQKRFEAVVDYILQRQVQYPEMHVYCYGHYESAAFRRTAERSSGEYQAKTEDFINHLLVDLHPVVKGSLALGLPGYGLKQVERMYKTVRETHIVDALNSVLAYQKWAEKPDGDPETSQHLRQILEYNKDDCRSTMELLKWLRKRCAKVKVEYVPKPPAEKKGKTYSARRKAVAPAKALEDFKKMVRERCAQEEGFRHKTQMELL